MRMSLAEHIGAPSGSRRGLAPGAMDQDLLSGAIERARDRLDGWRHADGHWAFELEADATIPSEYILLKHYLDEVDRGVEAELAAYLRAHQADHGGWPLFHGGAFDMSASVKAYFALKAAGDPPDAPHMARARAAILANGGAARANVFTRILLALFGEVPWRAVPVMPVEIMNLPSWFPFHLNKISYWSRTVLVPLLVIMALKPRARNPNGVHIQELFVEPPETVRGWLRLPARSNWGRVFRWIDAVLRPIEPWFSKRARARAISRAVAFVGERLNGEDGLGAIYPAMANAVMMYDCLGYPADAPECVIARVAIEKLIRREDGRTVCQPCLSPIWDTALAIHAAAEAGDADDEMAREGADWLIQHQILDVKGDWAWRRPDVRPGGWAFQYANPHYPDLDDTAVVVMALDRVDRERYRGAIDRAVEWVVGLQSRNGGWGAFDADNTYTYLNHIPFSDHGALLDPPTEDVTARCVGMLAQLGYDKSHPAVARGLEFLRKAQMPDGSWYGRWGVNYIYGTWSVLNAYNAAGVDMQGADVRRAVDWLVAKQRADGGWGEHGTSYWADQPAGEGPESTPSQTAWAVMGLMAAGEVDSLAVKRGIDYLTRSQAADGTWDEPSYTGTGFPRVFYLRYHGYAKFFPLWALARYRGLRKSNTRRVRFGI